MKYLRWLMAALLLVYAAMVLVFQVGFTAAYKLGRLPATDPDVVRMAPLFQATPWWEVALCTISGLLLIAAALRLFRGGRAFGLVLTAFALSLVSWWVIHDTAAYKAAFSEQERLYDYVTFAVLAVITLTVWFDQRRREA